MHRLPYRQRRDDAGATAGGIRDNHQVVPRVIGGQPGERVINGGESGIRPGRAADRAPIEIPLIRHGRGAPGRDRESGRPARQHRLAGRLAADIGRSGHIEPCRDAGHAAVGIRDDHRVVPGARCLHVGERERGIRARRPADRAPV